MVNVQRLTGWISHRFNPLAGGSWRCVSAVDREERTIWIADAHRGDGKRFVVRGEQKLTAFLELESAIRRRLPF